MFGFLKKQPTWLEKVGCKCQNCGVDLSEYGGRGLKAILFDPPLINGKPNKDPKALCRCVAVCCLCYRDYYRGEYSNEETNFCKSIHNKQGITIPNALSRDENGFFIQPPDGYIVPSSNGKIEPEPKFEFITNENISVQNAKNLASSKQSDSNSRDKHNENISIQNSKNLASSKLSNSNFKEIKSRRDTKVIEKKVEKFQVGDIVFRIIFYVIGGFILFMLFDLAVAFALVLGAAILGEKYPVLFIPLMILALILGISFATVYHLNDT